MTKHAGLRHLVESAGYSLAGLRRLLGEAAFRQELALAAAILALFAWFEAPPSAFVLQGALLLVLVAFEAMNTALEIVVDRLSPEWSSFAKEAKDLGSFAVFCLLAANLGYAALTVAPLAAPSLAGWSVTGL